MIAFGFAACFLLYGDRFAGPEPSLQLCLAQASLIYGSLTMGAAGVCCVILHLWFAVHRPAASDPPRWRAPALIAVPWVVFCSMALLTIINGLREPEGVLRSRDFFYCSVGSPVGTISCIVCGVFMALSLLFEVHIGITLFLGWRRRILRVDALPVDLLIRVGVFSLYAGLSVTAAIIMIWSSSDIAYLFIATLPPAIWVVFGTQRDVLRVWFCIRRTGESGTTLASSPGAAESRNPTSKEPATYLTSPYSAVSASAWSPEQT